MISWITEVLKGTSTYLYFCLSRASSGMFGSYCLGATRVPSQDVVMGPVLGDAWRALSAVLLLSGFLCSLAVPWVLTGTRDWPEELLIALRGVGGVGRVNMVYCVLSWPFLKLRLGRREGQDGSGVGRQEHTVQVMLTRKVWAWGMREF